MDTETAQKIESHLARIALESEAIRTLLNQSKPVFPKLKEAMVANRQCVQCGEVVAADKKYLRGCDEKHYRSVMRAIENGEITEREAIESGLLYYDNATGRPKSRSPVQAFIAQKEIAATIKQRTVELASDKKKQVNRGKPKP